MRHVDGEHSSRKRPNVDTIRAPARGGVRPNNHPGNIRGAVMKPKILILLIMLFAISQTTLYARSCFDVGPNWDGFGSDNTCSMSNYSANHCGNTIFVGASCEGSCVNRGYGPYNTFVCTAVPTNHNHDLHKNPHKTLPQKLYSRNDLRSS